MPNKKVIILLISLCLILILILILRIFFNNQSTPTPSTSPQKFSILSPTTNTEVKTDVTEPIKIRFSVPVAKESLKLELIPVNEIELNFDTTNTELTVEPTNAWNFDTTYFIKITKDTKSIDGQVLTEDYTYSFKTFPYSGI